MLLVIIKIPNKHADKGFISSIILIILGSLAVLTKTPSMIIFGSILTALAIVSTAFFYTKGNWEYVGWDDPLFPDD